MRLCSIKKYDISTLDAPEGGSLDARKRFDEVTCKGKPINHVHGVGMAFHRESLIWLLRHL